MLFFKIEKKMESLSIEDKTRSLINAVVGETIEKNMYVPPKPVSPESGVRKGPGMGEDDESVRIDGQNFAVISFVAPFGARQRAKRILLKIRGVFSTVEEAREYVKTKLAPADPDFDLFIVDMWSWKGIPPTEHEEKQRAFDYSDPKMQKIMQGHYKQMERNEKTMEMRKNFIKQKNRENEKRNRREQRKKQHGALYVPPESDTPNTTTTTTTTATATATTTSPPNGKDEI